MAETKQKSSPDKGTSNMPKVRVVRLNIHPLLLIASVIVIFFLLASLFNPGSSVTKVSVDEFIRGIKQNTYSAVQIQDTGEILAQEKFLLVSEEIEPGVQLTIPNTTKGVSLDTNLKEISLTELIKKVTPLGTLEQLKNALNQSNAVQVIELIQGEDFVIARTFSKQTDDFIVRGVSEEELKLAARDAGVTLPQVVYTRSASQTVARATIEQRAMAGDFVVVYRVGEQTIARIKDSSITTYAVDWDGGITSFAATLQRENISLGSDNIQIGSVIVASVNWSDIISLVTLVGFVVLGFILFRGIQGSGNSLMRFGQSKARMFWGVKPDVTFKDVAGIDEAKEELAEIVQFLKTPQKFVDLGARIPKGVLMVGSPGTGKTLLARAIAGEAGVPFFHTSGSEFEEMLVGAGASRVRDLFEKAKKASPSLIFIDEIDAVARKRGTTVQSSTTEQTLNQILVEMDGFEQGTNVIVIAATNRPDVLDPAILRPGRFDRRVVLDLPDIEGRKQILGIHARNKPLAKDVDLEKVAKRTTGFSGAELENTLNEAAIIAAKHDRKEIMAVDIEEAATKVTMGPAKQNRKRTEDELNLVAVHEAGHAVVSKFVEKADPVHRVSIVSRGMAGGVTQFLPQDDSRIISRQRLLSQVAVALGGRAAEEVVLQDVSTGASSDINMATSIVRNMVQKYGMSEKLGLIKYGESNELQYLGYGYGEQRDYSDETAKLIDEEVRSIMQSAYEKAKDIIVNNRTKFDKLVKLLREKEVVEGEEFDKLFV
ncbi:MAG: ATP-dependent zinc metalloprotease FtsH [Candidatus Doudnabacteria bacterium]|nr:ATP-dependent zinc metalloprotease FtsH [Candidatus Doudnabacteria bacterium]